MKYYLITDKTSGDLHGSNLMKELKTHDPRASFRFFGGDLMKAVSDNLVIHYREMAFMGIINVLLHLKTIKRNFDICKSDILAFQPNVLILIDYPGFNLRIAEFAKANGIKVFYYIAPKVWAWKEYRIKKIKAFTDELFTILPFETEYFKKHGINANYVGNPLTDVLEEFKNRALPASSFRSMNNLDERPIVAFLAGSRSQEIRNTLPVMIKSVEGISDFQFIVAGVNLVDAEIYGKILNGTCVKVIFDQTYDILNNAHAALVASGTAALETALFNVPQAVLYRVEGGWIIHVLMKYFFLKIK